MKTRLILFVFILFVSNEYVKAQKHRNWDTVFLDIPELIVNNPSFLYDLDTMFQKSYLCEIEDDGIFTIYVEQTSEDIYLFTIIQAPIYYRRMAGAKGFFQANGTYYFVVGFEESLSKYPKGLFTITDKQQQFYYINPPESVVGFKDGECWIDLEYREGKLFFIRKYW